MSEMDRVQANNPAQIVEYAQPRTMEHLYDATILGAGRSDCRSIGSGEELTTKTNLQTGVRPQTVDRVQTGGGVQTGDRVQTGDGVQTGARPAAGDRPATIDDVSTNSKALEDLCNSQRRVGELLMFGNRGSASERQLKSIAIADALRPEPMQRQIDSLKTAIASTSDVTMQKLLRDELTLTSAALAAPFTERARLAAIELKDGKPFLAEKTLDAALSMTVAPQAFSSPELVQLRRDAERKKLELHVENNLLPLFDASAQAFYKTNGRKDIRQSDLSADALQDPVHGAVNRYLHENYERIKGRFHFPGRGISRADVESFVRQRNKAVTEFVP